MLCVSLIIPSCKADCKVVYSQHNIASSLWSCSSGLCWQQWWEELSAFPSQRSSLFLKSTSLEPAIQVTNWSIQVGHCERIRLICKQHQYFYCDLRLKWVRKAKSVSVGEYFCRRPRFLAKHRFLSLHKYLNTTSSIRFVLSHWTCLHCSTFKDIASVERRRQHPKWIQAPSILHALRLGALSKHFTKLLLDPAKLGQQVPCSASCYRFRMLVRLSNPGWLDHS